MDNIRLVKQNLALACIYWVFSVFIAVSVVAPYAGQSAANSSQANWNLTVVSGDQKVVLSYDEVSALPTYQGYGGFFSTVGIKSGPYKIKGVTLEDLCNLVGGATSADIIFADASDGYSMAYSYDQIMGNFITYDPATLQPAPHGDMRLVLMYQQNGRALSNQDGAPFRIAIVSPDQKLDIEGSYWVKWVNEIEIVPIQTS